QIIFMERDLAEVISSQKAMLLRRTREGAEISDQQLASAYAEQLQRVASYLATVPSVRIMRVNYAELLQNPAAGIARLETFIGAPFDREKAIAAVQPNLRRQVAALTPTAGQQ